MVLPCKSAPLARPPDPRQAGRRQEGARMIELMIAAALMQAGDPCQAVPQGATTRSCPSWRSEARTPHFETFSNPASVVRSDGAFEISIRIVYAADRPDRVRSAIARYRFDCAPRTSVPLRLTTYDAAGIVVEDGAPRGDQAAPASLRPGSPSERLRDEFCPRG
jgi:hypothetical protein